MLVLDGRSKEAPSLLRTVMARGDRRDRLDAVSLWLFAIGPEELDFVLDTMDGIVKETPTWGHAHYVRGEVLAYQGRRDEAKKAYDRALELTPSDITARAARAHLEDEIGDYPAARADFIVLVEKYPMSADTVFALGVVEERLGEKEKALERYDRAIELWPPEAQFPALYRRALIFYERSEWERAARDLEPAVEAAPFMPSEKLLARCYVKLGRRTLAREAYDKVVAHDPYGVDTILEAGAVREVDDPVEETKAYYTAALERIKEPEARARIEARIRALGDRAEYDKFLREKQRTDLALARNAETGRILKEYQVDLAVLGTLPDGTVRETACVMLKVKLDRLMAYQKETERLLEK
jgi:tetratricopeptide (TPR) repeat protein